VNQKFWYLLEKCRSFLLYYKSEKAQNWIYNTLQLDEYYPKFSEPRKNKQSHKMQHKMLYNLHSEVQYNSVKINEILDD